MNLKPKDFGFNKLDLTLVFLIGLMLILSIYLPPIFKYPPNPAPPTNGCITKQQLLTLGKPLQNKEASDIIAQIKNDMKIDKEVITLEGPYWIASGILAASFPEFLPDEYSFLRYYIVVDSDFYKNLNSEEKKAIIAHEMGHIDNIEEIIRLEIDADNLATKYVSPQISIDLLNKAISDKIFQKISKEYKLRMENLEKQKKDRHQ